jgi:hypothetical protein
MHVIAATAIDSWAFSARAVPNAANNDDARLRSL